MKTLNEGSRSEDKDKTQYNSPDNSVKENSVIIESVDAECQ